MFSRWSVAGALAVALMTAGCAHKTAPPSATARAVAPTPQCDATLWQHVYAGNPARFPSAQDRLKIIQPCLTVTGTVFNYVSEPDGDYHVRVTLDQPYLSLLNDKNMSEQSGHLVIEPVCSNKVTQADVLKEGVCKGFKQQIFKAAMKGKRVQITGAYVEDMEHGWREIHPVTSITVLP